MKITILLVLISSFCFAAVLFTVPQLVFGIAVQINPAEFDTKFFYQYSYAKNYENMNPDNLFQDEISNNPKVQSMIYFHKTKKFNHWFEKMKRKNQRSKILNQDYQNLENLIHEIKKLPRTKNLRKSGKNY